MAKYSDAINLARDWAKMNRGSLVELPAARLDALKMFDPEAYVYLMTEAQARALDGLASAMELDDLSDFYPDADDLTPTSPPSAALVASTGPARWEDITEVGRKR